MEASALIEGLNTLRQSFEQPLSDMEIIRRSIQANIARLNGIEMPPLLSQDQRAVFAGKIEVLTEFLASEDGADAVELLMNTFRTFAESRIPTVDESRDNPIPFHD